MNCIEYVSINYIVWLSSNNTAEYGCYWYMWLKDREKISKNSSLHWSVESTVPASPIGDNVCLLNKYFIFVLENNLIDES